ncbi:MAG TPA: 4-hydroxyphenylacetate 3-hydroxylase N-terminal domain-containing protein [Xanthobacteraceae bacterium]|jgi:4-hydroxyphenylacetate 3-monooxygenase|nr:4-hydroxyphenylacetate 3-hydroxylase N-terminal domain-containing protein [Xanthobacteraceae bacterium]
MRTGSDFLRSLNDGRRVFLDGEQVKDVSAHPAFRQAARSIASLFDIAADPAQRERMTYTSPKTGEPVWRAWQIPRSHADLKARRLFSEAWAEATFGLMGRAPDHVAGFFAGYAAVPQFFASAGGQQKFADNLVAFYEYMRDNHIYCSYAIVPPQIDRSRPAHKQSDPTLYAGVVKERDDGIVISGAQQLATGGAISDYIQLSCIQPLAPGDDNYANCLAVPVAAEGLKLYPRKPYARAGSANDYPLSTRFDESDSYVVFDNVFVPWEHVFIYRNVELSRDQWRKTPSHLLGNHQAQTRYVTKLRFMVGLAQRMNETTGNVANPVVQTMMGELASFASIYESMLLSHEVMGTIEDGVLWPSRTSYYAASALQSELNGRMLEIIREMAGSAFITLPSSDADFKNPAIAADLERYMASGTSDAKTRIKLMRLIWDFLGSEFGSRHAQYEKFYGGPSFAAKQNLYRNYDLKRAGALVDKALNLPPVE